MMMSRFTKYSLLFLLVIGVAQAAPKNKNDWKYRTYRYLRWGVPVLAGVVLGQKVFGQEIMLNSSAIRGVCASGIAATGLALQNAIDRVYYSYVNPQDYAMRKIFWDAVQAKGDAGMHITVGKKPLACYSDGSVIIPALNEKNIPIELRVVQDSSIRSFYVPDGEGKEYVEEARQQNLINKKIVIYLKPKGSKEDFKREDFKVVYISAKYLAFLEDVVPNPLEKDIKYSKQSKSKAVKPDEQKTV